MDAAHRGVFCRHVHHIVFGAASERTGTQRDAVVRVIDDFQEAVEILFARDNAWQSENAPARVVFMDGHVHVTFRSDGNDALKKISEVCPKVFLGHFVVFRHDGPQLLARVARVPAGQREVAVAFQRVHGIHLLFIVDKACRAVRQAVVKLRARPVKHRHEIVADAADAGLGKAADVLAVIFDIAVARGFAEFDVLVHRHTFNDLKLQAVIFRLFFQRGNALAAPNFTDGHVVYSGDDGLHVRNLTNILEGHGVVRAIPAK